jgi:hypothetical protein
MTNEIFNIDIHIHKFHIPDFCIDNHSPIEILYNQHYLTCFENRNIVYFTEKNDTLHQKWVIEKDDSNHFYIKSCAPRKDYTQFLGSPNQDNNVFLYTSKNKYTRWEIKKSKNQKKRRYHIHYVGEKFDSTLLSVVVARYNENLEWVIPYNDVAIIYNKGHPCPPIFNHIIQLPNIGREGHTYLHHIINNYTRLQRQTFFLQGSPFEHNETVLFGIDNHFENLDFQPLGLVYLKEQNIPPREIVDTNMTTTPYGLKYMTLPIDGNIKCPLYPDIGIENLGIHYEKKYFTNKTDHEHTTMIDHYLERSRFTRTTSLKPTMFEFSFCALFSVKNTNIMFYSVDVYNNLLQALLDDDDQGGASGYILERLWLSIFTRRL